MGFVSNFSCLKVLRLKEPSSFFGLDDSFNLVKFVRYMGNMEIFWWLVIGLCSFSQSKWPICGGIFCHFTAGAWMICVME